MQKGFNKAIEVITVIFMVIIIFSVIAQVFFRYVLGAPLGWTEEIGRFSLVWLTFLGTYLAFCRARHMSVSLISERISKRWQITTYLVSNIIMIIFFIFLIKYGFSFSKHMIQFYPDTLPISMGIIYSIIPIGGMLYLFFTVKEVIATLLNLRKKIPTTAISDGKGD